MDPRHNADHYERPDVVASYAESRASGLFPREERGVERFFPDSGRLLDLGCGAGRTTAALEARGFDVVGVDVSRPMARETSVATGVPCVVGDASRLPFSADSFDCVLFSYNGLDELQPERARHAALAEVRRVLVPGGRLAFSSHNVVRQFVPFPPTPSGLGARLRFWLANARAGLVGTRYKLDTPSDERSKVVYFGDPLSEYRQLRAMGFDVLAFLGKRGRPSRYLGPGYFVVAESSS
jgi:SAM-dependent methyltransferase